MSSNTNPQKQSQSSVKVCIRMRPLLQHEDAEFWQIDENSNTIFTANAYNNTDLLSESYSLTNLPNRDIKRALMDSIYSPQNFAFDKVYAMNSNSQIIYKEMCRDITKSVINGFNCSIFMYGQTTSGKTFTMLGSPSSPGILPCTLRDVFNMINKDEKRDTFNVYCSYVEIYNENIHDLLTDANFLKLIDDNKYGVVVAGAKRVKINNFEDGVGIKDFGEENRKYRETLFNEYSSRSHTIFQIFIESIENKVGEDGIEYTKSRFSCLNLVDLAGSERITEYDPNKEGNGETGYINKSLFVLANVINRLAENSSKKNHIPYRDSKLTRLLSQALGGNSMTAIICTVSPAALNYYQTLSTLRFAMRAKNVKLKPMANEFLDDKGKVEFYKNEIRKLQNELKNKRKNEGGEDGVYKSSSQTNLRSGGGNDTNREMYEKIMKTNESLANELKNYKDLYLKEKTKCDLYKQEIEKLKGLKGGNYNTISNLSNINNTNELSNSTEIKALINKLSKGNNDARWKEKSSMIQNEYQNEVERIKNEYINKINNLHSTLFSSSPNYNSNPNPSITYLNNNSTKNINNNEINHNNNNPNSNSNNNNNIIVNNVMISPSNNNGKEKKNNIHLIASYNSNRAEKSDLFKSSDISSNNDDIISKIQNGTIFDSIILNYLVKSHDNFEDNVKNLKSTYETKVDTLEKTMDYYKSYIENFYRKKIQETRNTNMDSVELIEGNLPIMQITSEHNDTLKKLRELYDVKIKDLETKFFSTLRMITAKRMDDMSTK